MNAYLQIQRVVNLSDWRDRARVRRRRRVLLEWGAGVVCALLLSGITLGLIDHSAQRLMSQVQQGALARAALAAGVRQSRDLARDLALWRSVPRLLALATASRDRFRLLLLDMSAHVSPGLRIDSVIADGDAMDVRGTAATKAQAVEFVRALKARGWPALAPTVTAAAGDSRSFQFLIKPKVRKAK